jgi:hypothetical protein
MALAETTLGSACTAGAKTITVASATSIGVGTLLKIEDELFRATKAYVVGSTEVPVTRGLGGNAQVEHPSGARVTHGTAADFGNPGVGTPVSFPPAGRARVVTSVSATGTLTLAPAGVDHVVILNGTSVITLTIPVPGKDKDGDRLTVVANGAAAHVPTFTGGLGGAGSGYDAVTFNGTGTIALEVIACNELWVMATAPAMGGTVTNIIGSIA